MNISANTLLNITLEEKPSSLAYYLAHAYMKRWEILSREKTFSETRRQKQMLQMAFLAEVVKKYLKLSDALVSLEDKLKDGK